jgi:hypothetical protein
MMACEGMGERLQELVDGQGPSLLETRAHVERCPACRREFEALSAAASAVAGLDYAEPPKGFEETVLRQVRLRRSLTLAVGLAVSALLCTWAAAAALLSARLLRALAAFLLDPWADLPWLKLRALQAFVLGRDLWDVLSTLLRLRLGSPEFVPLHWLAAACLAAAALAWVRPMDKRI